MNIILNFISCFFAATISTLAYMIFSYNKKVFYLYCENVQAFEDCDIKIIENHQCLLLKNKITTFGRAKTADIIINDMTVSKQHFKISIYRHKCCIIDCQSSNGTFVNGKRIEKQYLVSNDTISVGKTTFRFCEKYKFR